MEHNFDYIIEKIKSAKELEYPFNHFYIKNLFSNEHYSLIQNSSQINIPVSKNIVHLINNLHKTNWEIMSFPGCVTDIKTYVQSIKTDNFVIPEEKYRETLSSFGLCFKLKNSDDEFIKQLVNFFKSESFINCIIKKLKIRTPTTYYIFDIQKYLSGYEISPHPDNRFKKATLMININNEELNKDCSIHTSMLKPKEQTKKIIEFWKENIEVERDYLKWNECEIVKTHSDTNSLLLFSPNNETIHGVKLKYNDLQHQRTNLYANIWVDRDINKIRRYLNINN